MSSSRGARFSDSASKRPTGEDVEPFQPDQLCLDLFFFLGGGANILNKRLLDSWFGRKGFSGLKCI